MNFFKKLGSFFRSKWGRWILIIIVLFLLFLLVRGCHAKILRSNLYHIVRPANWNPIQLSGKEANMQAFIDELVGKIAQDQKLEIDLATLQTENLFPLLDHHDYDGILLALSIDPFLLQRYDVSESIYLAGPVLVVATDGPVHTLTDLKGKGVGIAQNSALGFRLTSLFPNLLLVSYENILTALNDLENQQLGGVIMEAQLAYTYTKVLFSGKLRVATPPLFDLGIRLVTSKEAREAELIQKFNAGLLKLKNDGTYDQLLQRWELVSP